MAALTGIAAGDIVQLAREYATTRPAVIRLNYGVQRSEQRRRGGTRDRGSAGADGIMARGRGRTAAFHIAGVPVQPRGPGNAGTAESSPLGREARLVNMSQLGKALTDLDEPPVKAMVVYNSNPAAIAPNQNLVLRGLRREDLFTVVLEQFQTDTADYADIVLPVTTFLEHTDSILATGTIICNWRVRRCRLPASRGRTSRSSACWRGAWVSTTPVSATPKTT